MDTDETGRDADPVIVDGRGLTLEDVERVARGGSVRLHPEAAERMEESRAVVTRSLMEGRVVYGVTTGFGRLADTAIAPEQIRQLQVNLLRSHAVGIGEPLPPHVTRAIMVLRANTLAGGHCGVRPVLPMRLLAMLEAGLHPRVPSRGSVGASGDLAPLAHLGLTMIGEGEMWDGEHWVPARRLLQRHGLEPLELQAKEGLALVNGTQVMTAIGILGLLEAERVVEAAELAGALSLEATNGTRTAFRPEIHRLRPHPGQVESARRLRAWLGSESEISRSHAGCEKVQDAYSFRCMPQVHGAVRDALAYVRRVLEIEINAATDNPLVLPAGDGEPGAGEVVAGGNFHGAPVAAALDFLAIAMTDLGSISERRIEALVDPAFSGLPAFLVEEPGLRSGFMMHQVTAAALVSESKGLAHPASVDSIPTSANKEDHVSMGVWAAHKAARVIDNVLHVVAIELLAAAQGLDLRRPLRSSEPLERAYDLIRLAAAPLTEDRPGSTDIQAVAALVTEGKLLPL